MQIKPHMGIWGNVFRKLNLIGIHACMHAGFGEGQRGALVNCDQDLPSYDCQKLESLAHTIKILVDPEGINKDTHRLNNYA